MTLDIKDHWEHIYQTKKPDEVSWYQDAPSTSLELISEIKLDKNASIIDIGAGDSRLVDSLIGLGFRNITALDISSNALERSKKRLGDKADSVRWVVSDLREFETKEKYDLWHDRAALHFLTDKKDIKRYMGAVKCFLKPNGYVIASAFSVKGPKRCSGLEVRQYSEDSMKKLFSDFEHLKLFEEEHKTPWGTSQMFMYDVFRRGNNKR